MSDQNAAPATAPATTESQPGTPAAAESSAPAAAAQESILNGDKAATPEGDKAAAPAGEKPAEGEKPTGEITYTDFTMPEGMQVDKAALEVALPVFKELGLNQDQAQKLVDLQANMVKANQDAWMNTITEWQKQARADKEFGGDKFDESVKTANFAVKKYGNDAFVKMLADYGVGNHPEMVRFMLNVGRTLKEDVPGSSGGSVKGKQDVISILYPNQ